MQINKEIIDYIDLISLKIQSDGCEFNFRLVNKAGNEIGSFKANEKNFAISDKTDKLIAELLTSLEEDYLTLLLGAEQKEEVKEVGDLINEKSMTMKKWLGVKDDDFEM